MLDLVHVYVCMSIWVYNNADLLCHIYIQFKILAYDPKKTKKN